MSTKINLRMFVVFALVLLVLGVNQSLTQDWSSVIKEAKAKFSKVQLDIKDMTMIQEMKMHVVKDKEAPDKMESKMFKKGGKFRIETKMPMPGMTGDQKDMQTIIIFDGKDTWMIAPFVGKQKLNTKESKRYDTERNWWELMNEKAKIVGSEKIDGRDCYIVEGLEKEDMPFTKIWIDKKSFVLVKAESKSEEGGKLVIDYSDFKKLKGDWEMAYKTDVYDSGKLMSTSIIKSVEVNKGVSDELFDPNKVKDKEMNMQEMMKKMMEKKGKNKND